MNDPRSNFDAWLGKADSDLLNIENNLMSHHVAWDTVCFHAQQAAKKLLKAFLVFHGRELNSFMVHSISHITDSDLPLYMLRMTALGK